MLTRRFEVGTDAAWMNYSIDDLLYGMIQHFATFNPAETNENHKLYLTKQNYTKNRKIIKDCCGVSTQTLNNHLKKLISEGIIEEFTLKVGKKEYPSYGIVVKRENPYKIIDNDWLFYLLGTRSSNAIKVYFTLLDWFEFKKDYEFTQKQIAEVLGYSANARNGSVETLIRDILESFKREGIIDYVDYYEEKTLEDGRVIPTPKRKLTFVAKSKAELKRV